MKNHLSFCRKLLVHFSIVWLALAALQSAAGDLRQIVNAGHGGDTSADLLVRLQRDVQSRSPEVVVLLVGTNDWLNSHKALTAEQYEKNLRTLVREILAGGSKLLLVTIPPAYEPYLVQRHGAKFFEGCRSAQRVAAANTVIRQVAREHNLPLVDFFAACEQAGGATALPGSLIRNVANSGAADGVHPTAAGYELLAGLVVDALRLANMQHVRRIVCFGDSLTQGVHTAGEGTSTGETYPAFLKRRLEAQNSPAVRSDVVH